jgi:hypothetical protein
MTIPTHYVIDGNQVKTTHPDKESAQRAAVLEAKKGRTSVITQLVETVTPNTGAVVTSADGSQTIVQD